MIWSFFKNNGGQESGFHDAGVETFKGNLERYLAREIIQNSLDARDDMKKPVLVTFELMEIPLADIPDSKSLVATFHRCAEYWPRDVKTKEFFERAESLARAKKVASLKVADYNTKGVTGNDSDREDNWYNLIRCSGASSKWAGEGGSYGIGKNAPFAASRMRVVLYSTFTKSRESAFQGVARLVSHKLPKGEGIAQHIGYLGADDGSSIREKRAIPSHFVRTKTGTDLIILGYNAEESWAKDLIFSVLENFWPAIHFGDLEVEVAGTRINKGNLDDLLNKYSSEGEFTAHLYYRAFTEKSAKHFENVLPTLKKVEVRLLAGEQGLPKRVAMVRKTGMVIYLQHYRSLVPYCGVFLCRSDIGNRLLRDMEPPRHDDWDPDHPEKNSHRKTFSEFTSFIRDCVQKLAPADNDKVLAIPDLSQYLPDDDETPEETFDGEDSAKRESFQRQPEAKSITGRKLDRSRRSMQPDASQPGEGDSETEQGGEGTGTGGSAGGGSGASGGGAGGGAGGGGNAGGVGEGSAGPKDGSGAGKNAKPAIPIRGRVYAKSLSDGVYSVIAEALKQVKGDVLLTIKAIGDDASGSVVRIAAARSEDGTVLHSPRPGVVGPMRFGSKGRLTVEITLVEPRKLAMEVEAHEAEQ
jgi:uncharacterized membrane protein YgcG